ncbi:MAG: hypothetical protein ACFB5Z_16925 [Elainellaceae cyanobacterium]
MGWSRTRFEDDQHKTIQPLKVDEVREVTNIARRIAAILLLEAQLNDNYEAVKESTYD